MHRPGRRDPVRARRPGPRGRRAGPRALVRRARRHLHPPGQPVHLRGPHRCFDLGGDPGLARLARIVYAADIATPTRSGRRGEQLGQPAATARPWRRRQPKAGQGAVVDCAAGGRAAAWPAGVAWLFPRAWHLGSPGRLPVARSSWSTTTRAASRPGPGRALDNPAPCASRGEIKTRKKTDLGTAAGVTTTFALLTREPGG